MEEQSESRWHGEQVKEIGHCRVLGVHKCAWRDSPEM